MIPKHLRPYVVSKLLSDGMTQEAISESTTLALGTIRKAMREAMLRGILTEKMYRSIMTYEELLAIAPYLTDYDLSMKVLDALEPYGVQTVYVIPSAANPRDTGRFVARAAADLFRVSLMLSEKGRNVVGLAWGRRLRDMIDFTNLPQRGKENLILMPLNGALSIRPGEPLHGESVRCTSSHLVRDVALRLGLESDQWWQFPLPAFLPRALLKRPELLRAVRSGVTLDPTYQALFGPNGLIEEAGTVFSACSGLEKFAACVEFGAFDPRLIEYLREHGIVGDWNGHLLSLPTDEGRALAAEHNQLALGASPADMARVAARARTEGFLGLGVVLVVSGVRRAEVVRAACELGAVNQLVIAEDTANAMLEPPSSYRSAA